MSYYVNIGGINLHNVTSVKLDADRGITDYDGLGSGKFDVAENAGLKTYTISCELSQEIGPRFKSWSASELFKQFDTWRNQKDPIRLIITSEKYPKENVSMLAIFKGYSKSEKYEGISETEIQLKEYKAVGVKTTDVPYISRPGKVPIPPKITITKKNTIYSVTKNITGKAAAAPKAGEKGFIGPVQQVIYKEFKTGKPISNPVTVKSGITYTPQTIGNINFNSSATQPLYGEKRSWSDVGNAIASTVSATGNAIGKAFDSWQKRRADFEKKIR